MADSPRRVNYFQGQLVDADDLVAEQEYHRRMRYLHNRLHGYGTISGLEVDVEGDRASVSPGTAIDVLGREIIVTAPLTIELGQNRSAGPWQRDLVIVWCESLHDPVPTLDEAVGFTRWVEEPELGLVAPGTAEPEALVLARLARTGRRAVAIDASMRRPLGPA